jgi:hypothetical protein
MRPAKIVAIVFGALLSLIGLALFVPGIILLGAYGALKDDAGFLQTSTRDVSSDGYAIVSPDLKLNIGSDGWEWVPTGGRLAFRIVASSNESSELFIGIGPSDKVAEYLKGVAYDEIADYGWRKSTVGYRHYDGVAPSTKPTDQSFWVVGQSGFGDQDVRWDTRDGDWTAVIMNADGTAPVDVNLSLGARFGILLPIGIGITVFGFVLLAVGILLIVLGVRHSRSVDAAPPVAGWGPTSGGYGPSAGEYAPSVRSYTPPAAPSGWQQQPPAAPKPASGEPSAGADPDQPGQTPEQNQD